MAYLLGVGLKTVFVQCCFASVTETVLTVRGREPEGYVDFHTAPELCNSGSVQIYVQLQPPFQTAMTVSAWVQI